ncbi:hypothetical protein STHU_47220 [Allostella humosa]|nr:response regulator [Stella humosa]BBK34088.1 hypothetical protein STHU_47220 [Stella humosa]
MSGLRILVIEDDAVIGLNLSEMLEGLGHAVCGVEATEAEAVAAAERHRPDLMIVDAWLGDGSGVAAVDRICRAGPIPHIFVSGDVAGVKALRPGAEVVEKPFRESDLTRAIHRVLGIGGQTGIGGR